MKNIQNKTIGDNSSNKSILIRLVEGIIFFKSWILKITLIALLIKIFRKYRIFRVLWRFTNWIAVSIFGWSLMDLYGIDYLANIIDWIKNNSLTQLFKTKVENIEQVKEIPSSLKTYNRTTTGNEESNKIGDWYNRLLNREPEVTVEDETPIYKNRYVITLAILLLLGLTYWGFKDSIDPVISDSIEKLQFFRSRANRDSTTICQDVVRPIEESNKSWWTGLTDKVKSWWNKDNTSDTPATPDSKKFNKESLNRYFKGEPGPSNLQNYNDLKGKGIDQSNLSEWEKTRRLMDQITGENKDLFDKEASSVLSQMNTFIINHENNTFPENLWLVQGMYVAINASLKKLRFSSDLLWKDLLQDENKQALINRFELEIYKEIGLDIDHRTMTYNNPELIKPQYKEDILNEYKKAESATYDEVANATIHEQDNWSNRGSLQSPHSHISEIGLFDETTEQVEIPELNVRKHKTTYAETLDKVQNITTDVPETPKISEKAGSLLAEYLEANIETEEFLAQKIKEVEEGPKAETFDFQKAKSKFSNLFEAINFRRDDSHVVEDSNIQKDNSDSSNSVTKYFNEADNPIEKVVVKDVKDTNLIITETYQKDGISIFNVSEPQDVISNLERNPSMTSKVVEKVNEKIEQNKARFTNLWDAIKSRRDDSHVVDETNIKNDVSQNIEASTDDKLTSLIEDAKVLSDQEILEKVKDTFSDNQEEQPVASSSKLTEEVKPSGSSELFKQIKSVKKEYGTPVIETKEELLKQVESHVNSPKVETPSIVVDKEESLPGILESVKGLNTGAKESLFNVGLSPRLEKSPSLHRAPSISNLFDDTQNLFVDDDDSSNTPFNVELTNWNDTKVTVDQAGGLFSIDFGENLKDVQELHITLNSGKIHILENNLENNKDFVFKWGDSDKNLDILNIDVLDKNNNNSRIYHNTKANILPDFEIKHKASLNSFANYNIKE